jgi:hypothetical protein
VGGVVEHRDVADDEGDKSQAGAGLDDDEGARGQASRQNVANAEGEQGGPADVEVGAQPVECGGAGHGIGEGCAQSEKEQCETGDQQQRPEHEQQQQRARAEGAVTLFAHLGIADMPREGRPGRPGGDVEETGNAEAAGGAAWQDDGLEGVEDGTQAEEQSGDEGGDTHGPFYPARGGVCAFHIPAEAVKP